MQRLIIFLIVFIASVWLGAFLIKDPGYALFTYREWSIEMPLWFLLLATLVLFLLGYLVLRFFTSIDSGMYRFRNWLRFRRERKSYSKTQQGLMDLIENQWKSAEQAFLRGIGSA